MINVFFRRCGNTYREQHAAAYELLYAAAALSGFKKEALILCRTEEGKPYFKGEGLPLFSLTHSGDYAACSIGPLPSGIDLERRREIPERVSRRFLGGATGEEALRRFTMRESCGKLTGGGFFTGDRLPDGMRFLFFEQIPGYLLTLCAPASEEIGQPRPL